METEQIIQHEKCRKGRLSGSAVTYKNCFHDNNESQLNSVNDCRHWLYKILLPRAIEQCKNLNVQTCKEISKNKIVNTLTPKHLF
jgi:hypothetical protein